jgi:hypothetical protein
MGVGKYWQEEAGQEKVMGKKRDLRNVLILQ